MIRQTALLLVIFGISIDGFSQFGSVQAGPAPRPEVVQLPLSGLSTQSNAVTATQSPIPGTTTSVNTINPSVQVQEPYKGSVPSTAPFNGKLALRDAMDRGFASNLGPVGLNNLLREATAQAKVVRSTLL